MREIKSILVHDLVEQDNKILICEGERNIAEELQRWRDVRAAYIAEDNGKRVATPQKAASVTNDGERLGYEYEEISGQRRETVNATSSSPLSPPPTLKMSRSLPSSFQEPSSSSSSLSRQTATPYIRGSERLRRQRLQEAIRWRREEIGRRQELEMHQADGEVWKQQEDNAARRSSVNPSVPKSSERRTATLPALQTTHNAKPDIDKYLPPHEEIMVLVARLTDVFDDVRQYRKLLTCRHSRAQGLLDTFQMVRLPNNHAKLCWTRADDYE